MRYIPHHAWLALRDSTRRDHKAYVSAVALGQWTNIRAQSTCSDRNDISRKCMLKHACCITTTRYIFDRYNNTNCLRATALLAKISALCLTAIIMWMEPLQMRPAEFYSTPHHTAKPFKHNQIENSGIASVIIVYTWNMSEILLGWHWSCKAIYFAIQ